MSEYSEELQWNLVDITPQEDDVIEAILNNVSFFLWMKQSMKGMVIITTKIHQNV